jgi:hypothetical protein
MLTSQGWEGVDIFAFGKLCHLVDRIDLRNLRARCQTGLSDSMTLIMRALTAAGETTVEDGGAGPVELWSLQQAIKATAWQTAWRPASR